MVLGLNRSEWEGVAGYFTGVADFSLPQIGAAYFTGIDNLEAAGFSANRFFLDSGFSTFRTPFSSRASPLFFEPDFRRFGLGRFGDISWYFKLRGLPASFLERYGGMPPYSYGVSPPPVPSPAPSAPAAPSPSHSPPPSPPPIAPAPPSLPQASLHSAAPPSVALRQSRSPTFNPPPVPPPPLVSRDASNSLAPPRPKEKPALSPKKKSAPAAPAPAKKDEASPKTDTLAKEKEEIIQQLVRLKEIRENFVARLQQAKTAGRPSRESFETEYRDVLALHEQLQQEVESGRFRRLPNAPAAAQILRVGMETLSAALQQVPARQVLLEKPSPVESLDWPKDKEGFPLPTEDILFRPYPVANTKYAIDFSLPDAIKEELDQKLPEMMEKVRHSIARKGMDETNPEFDRKFRLEIVEAIGQWAYARTAKLREASEKELQRFGGSGAASMPESLSIAGMFQRGMAECTELTDFLYAVCMYAKRNGPEAIRTKLQPIEFGFASIYELDVPHVALTATHDGQTHTYDLANPLSFGFGVSTRSPYSPEQRQDLALPQYVALLLSNKALTAPVKDHPALYDAALRLTAAKNAAVVHEASKYHYGRAIQAHHHGDLKSYAQQMREAQRLLAEAEGAEGNQFIKQDLQKTRAAIAEARRQTTSDT